MKIALRMSVTVLVLILALNLAGLTGANHEPLYKAGIDNLAPGQWEAHYVWLRSDHFNLLGEVWWRFVIVESSGTVDVFFLDWEGLQAFREGDTFEPLTQPLADVKSGYGWKSGLNSELPYFLVFENPGRAKVVIVWAIFTELDWRRWQGQPPGPTLDLTPVTTSPALEYDDTWALTFEEPGFYVIHTRPHLDTTGIVEVEPSLAPGPPVDVQIRNTGFHPEVIRIPAGTTVRWTNSDEVVSTVHVEFFPEGFPERAPPRPMTFWFLLPAALAAGGALALLRLSLKRPPSDSMRLNPSPPGPRN